jgi:antirestriction protein ArdC
MRGIVEGKPSGPILQWVVASAPAGRHSNGDFIMVPNDSSFTTKGSHYETVLHELAHWSEIRRGWTGKYEMNELLAEIAASFLSAELGVPQAENLENHAAYVKSWLEALRGDSTHIFRASRQWRPAMYPYQPDAQARASDCAALACVSGWYMTE